MILVWALAIPLLGGLGILAAGRWPNLREAVTLVTATILAVTVWSLIPRVMAGETIAMELLPLFEGVSLRFEAEPLGMLFAALASGLWIVNSLYSIGYMRGNKEHDQTRFYLFFAIALFAAQGVAFAGNMLTLFLFYEVLTVSTYPLVTHKGDAKSVRSARLYMGYLLATSIGLLLPAIIWTYAATGTLDFQPGGIVQGHVAGPLLGVLLALYVFGIGKAAVMPVHRWLPAAMVAPTPVSALLHAVAVVKAGVFSVIKVIVYIFGPGYLASQGVHDWMIWIAGFTIVAASLVALQQTNMKRMLAYSTISQLSYIVMAAAVLAPLSIIGAAVHVVAHACAKITLFFAAGAIYTASKKSELPQMNGIGRRMPITMTAFFIGALSMIGVPPTAGFVSKWYMLGGAFQAEQFVVVGVLIGSTVLNAAYFLPVVVRAFFREEDVAPKKDHGEAPLPAVIALSVTAGLTVLLFVFNQPVIDLAARLVGG
ncbi:MAG: monovalent cation/H+ antiporter subunit D family protein [Rhodothalassiaceae bacterium]